MRSFKFSLSRNKKRKPEKRNPPQQRPFRDPPEVTLQRKTISGVEFNSPTRNPPTFHPESRKALRTRLTTWLESNTDPVKGAFYLVGPACVGKTALVQSISDYCDSRGWIAATIFLSHVNRLDDNSRIIATISSQLSWRSPAFTQALGEKLAKDTEIFQGDLSSQFRKLIQEPAEVFRPRIFQSFKKPKPLVIILDGLDQSMNPSSQVELLQLIDAYIRDPNKKCPFQWIISGRLVPRWLAIISKPDNQYAEISIDDNEAIEDVHTHILRAGFRDIVRRFPGSFKEDEGSGEEWPTEAQTTTLSKEASGFFMMASCMLQFIADKTRQDPKGQLVRCLEFFDDPGYQREGNPLSPLYLVYQQILSGIGSDILTMTTSILQIISVESDNRVFHAQSVADSLNVDLSVLHHALDGLRSVVKISPTVSQSSTIEFYHTSFSEFLLHRVDPSRIKSLSHIKEISAGRSVHDNSDLGMVILLPIALVQADFDSPSRYPPPRCHRGTRILLRQKTSIWLADTDCPESILWVTGSVGVGKSAFAQTLAEECHRTARLGASLFFSHSLEGNEKAQRVIPTLACQLAAKFPEYKALINATLLADPMLVEKDLRDQFQLLIAYPLEELQKERRLYSPKNPLVIILDGLDVCGDKSSQVELTRLIGEFAKHKHTASGLFWIICSRPEPHVKKIIWRMTVQSLCRHEQLLTEDAEAKDDVELMLRDGFHEIRKRYFFRFGPAEIWPTDVHWPFLKDASSGFLMFASCILKYVEDEDQRDPRALLELCLGLVSSSLVPHTLHPFHPLDALYEQVLLSVPLEILPTTLRVLSLCVHSSHHGLLAQDAMTVLDIDRSMLDSALNNLHSVIDFSSPGTYEERLHFFHHSFPDFLNDPKRSGQTAREINMEGAESDYTSDNHPQASSSKVTLDKGKRRAYSESQPSSSLGFPTSDEESIAK